MINRVILIGRITKELVLKKTKTNKYLLNFSIAVNNGENTDFFDCTAWGITAENIAKYMAKGSLIGVDGALQTNKYVNKDRVQISKTYINVSNVQFLDNKKNQSAQKPNNEYNEFEENDYEDDSQEYESDGPLPF